jgi:hypothetical protein
MTCETMIVLSHATHVAPLNARGHWRQYTDATVPCDQPATVHVKVQYPDGQVVERDLCAECAARWQRDVREQEARGDIVALGIIRPKSVWVITELEVQHA